MPQDPDKTLVHDSNALPKEALDYKRIINESSQKVLKLTCLDEKGLLEQVETLQVKIKAKFQILDELKAEFAKHGSQKFNPPSFDSTIQKMEQVYLESEKQINECIDLGSRFT